MTFTDVADNSAQTGGRTLAEAADVIAAGHPGMAHGVILVDFDATLYPFGFLFDGPEPLPGAVEFMQGLKKAGFKIGIFTSRLSKKWLKSVNQTAKVHQQYIRAVCKRDGIPFDFMTAEKVPSQAIIDDKAIRYSGNWKDIDIEDYL